MVYTNFVRLNFGSIFLCVQLRSNGTKKKLLTLLCEFLNIKLVKKN